MKSTSGWESYTSGGSKTSGNGSNSSGFAGFPGGFRYGTKFFDDIGVYGNWWSSSENSTFYAWRRSLGCDIGYVIRNESPKWEGLSVRCLRD